MLIYLFHRVGAHPHCYFLSDNRHTGHSLEFAKVNRRVQFTNKSEEVNMCQQFKYFFKIQMAKWGNYLVFSQIDPFPDFIIILVLDPLE